MLAVVLFTIWALKELSCSVRFSSCFVIDLSLAHRNIETTLGYVLVPQFERTLKLLVMFFYSVQSDTQRLMDGALLVRQKAELVHRC
jgi:hypothetical protein